MTIASLTFQQPRCLTVGAGTVGEVGRWAAGGASTLVIATPITANFVERLELRGKVTVFDAIPGEPDIATLDAALEAARECKPTLIVGLGGGSVLDVAKLVAVLWDSDQSLVDVAGPNKVAGRKTGLVQVATTAGTGSEAGTRSLITDPAKGNKIAVESPHMIADCAVLDPELTYSVPPSVTAATGVDAMAHCVEAFTNRRAHPMIDGFARMGFSLVGKYLGRAVRDGTDTEAREGLMLASYYGGICLGPVNTAAGHAIAYPLGTRLRLPHGLANAIIFPHVLAFNQPAAVAKTAEVADALGFGSALSQDNLLGAACDFCRELGIEMSLTAHGATADDLLQFASEAHGIRRLMDNNPVDMNKEDVLKIYQSAL
ncbi:MULTISPECIES: iron-containing alcohol dehydrogenase [unclassified Rhizobium]|uniref:iron-containing alcohol dehydrogenase n=1 Tax=unclassified Rhizobium TaxID=2613769 RepID=UPI000BC4A68C|nr:MULTISPECIES: iron-containing alcohol dehydrogenase [unclassified Rhizobium]MDH7809501.1 alcohol dehydrogenase class IV [Rhizobium sp. AN67]MDQ4408750.1 iron-containing alcohol dehydrogenase [Rhizobium sp. AN63]SOD50415.1 Alcohol dehydrogenase, class IV [Rhizobium sp. AN6A]